MVFDYFSFLLSSGDGILLLLRRLEWNFSVHFFSVSEANVECFLYMQLFIYFVLFLLLLFSGVNEMQRLSVGLFRIVVALTNSSQI